MENSYKSIQQLLAEDIQIRILDIHQGFYHTKSNSTFTTPESGRDGNFLHILFSGEREYIVKEKHILVQEGNIVFIPNGTRYTTKAHSIKKRECGGIGIIFDLFDTDFNPISIYPDIYTDWHIDENKTLQLFRKIIETYDNNCSSYLHIKSLLYELLSTVFLSNTRSAGDYNILKPAIAYISKHYRENIPVRVYAEQCSLSESYFRKIFTRQMGVSPIDYRNQLRFNDAIVLYQKKKKLHEIAEIVGFGDASYLLRLYKKQTGKTFKKSFIISDQ